MHKQTFGAIISMQKGHTTGFDYLRIGLSLLVLFVHVAAISDHNLWLSMWRSWGGPFELSILPSFFILSGFLVSGSLTRNSVIGFLSLRAIRIFPALAVEVTLSAVFIGIFFTKMSFYQYLTSYGFCSYFMNIIGVIHFTLPGVFEGRSLNEQLWTIPFELECYICLVFLFMIGLFRFPNLFCCIILSIILVMSVLATHYGWYKLGWNVPGRTLVISFLCGCFIYLYKEKIPGSYVLMLISLVLTYTLLLSPNTVFVAPIPLSYVIIYIGTLKLPKVPFGDLSYGVYLFHFPLARCVYEIFNRSISWLTLLLSTIVLSTVFAALSWYLIEKPILDRKGFAVSWMDRYSKEIYLFLFGNEIRRFGKR